MKIEKIAGVLINVKNMDEAVRFFSDLLGITFEEVPPEVKRIKTITEHADPALENVQMRIAISPTGLELIETVPAPEKEGLRSVMFKVPDIEQAKADIQKMGVRLIADIKLGGLREALFRSDDLYGARVAIVEYDTPTVMESIKSVLKK